MDDFYRQMNLFDDQFEEGEEEVYAYKGYTLTQSNDENELFLYRVYDEDLVCIARWKSRLDALDMKSSEFKRSMIYDMFLREANKAIAKTTKNKPYYNDITKPTIVTKPYEYKPDPEWQKKQEEKTKEQIAKYSHSDTLVIHKSDPSTTMLRQIYEGKDWDVINDTTSLTSSALEHLLDNHKRIVLLGHGSGYGLFGSVNPSHAQFLKGKKLFLLWCNADAYRNKYLSDENGFFCCGNMPSDAGEAAWVGYHVSEEYMLENITYWCKLCGDVVEQCLDGDAKAGCKYIRDKYWEKYHIGTADEVGITKYNYVRTKVAGQDNLPEPTGEEIISK